MSSSRRRHFAIHPVALCHLHTEPKTFTFYSVVDRISFNADPDPFSDPKPRDLMTEKCKVLKVKK